MNNYPPSTLKGLQTFLLQMVKDFDAICKEYGITYWGCFGTAIGAVRHNGFIPWDDDIDLGVMFSDYKKLLSIPQSAWEKRDLMFVTGETGEKYHTCLFAKVYKKGTIFETDFRQKYFPNNECSPIWIDVFVFNHFKDVRQIKDNIGYSSRSQKLYWASKLKSPWKLSVPRRLLYILLNLIPIPPSYGRIYNRFYNRVAELDKCGGDIISSLTVMEKSEMLNIASDEKEMFPVNYVKYEDFQMPVLKNNHTVLRQLYGDYMEMPPEDKRINHSPAILDFGDGRGNVLKK